MGGTWLYSDVSKAVTLDEREHLQGFEEMDPVDDIDDYFGANRLQKKRIHVLVVVPEGAAVASELDIRSRGYFNY